MTKELHDVTKGTKMVSVRDQVVAIYNSTELLLLFLF